VSIVEPETEPTDAEMVVVPADGPLVTRPLVPAVLLIVATLPDDEFQATCVVIFWLVPSEYVPEPEVKK
jgi:hypothetical protein